MCGARGNNYMKYNWYENKILKQFSLKTDDTKLHLLVNKCYEDGFEDGVNETQSEAEKDFKQVENLISGARKDAIKYHLPELKETGFDKKTDDIEDFIDGLEYNGYENLAWYNGYIRGLREAEILLKK